MRKLFIAKKEENILLFSTTVRKPQRTHKTLLISPIMATDEYKFNQSTYMQREYLMQSINKSKWAVVVWLFLEELKNYI